MRFNRSLLIAAAGVASILAGRALIRSRRKISLRGKSVLVTGGSRGLGLALAREFAREGARVAICARDGAELNRALAEPELSDSGAIGMKCDVTDVGQVRQVTTRMKQEFGGIDVLVNNAGVISVGPAELMTLDDYREAMNTHFWGPLYTTLEALPEMLARRRGSIVNIASIGGKISVPHLVPYNASKFALVGLSEGLSAELAKEGIRVTTVCPGLMRTGSPPNVSVKGKHRAEYAWFSILDALPVSSISVRRAARAIVNACKEGRAEIVLSPQAKLAALIKAILPGFTIKVLGVLDRLLPSPGGIGSDRVTGRESKSAWSPSILTLLNDKAAAEYNQGAA